MYQTIPFFIGSKSDTIIAFLGLQTAKYTKEILLLVYTFCMNVALFLTMQPCSRDYILQNIGFYGILRTYHENNYIHVMKISIVQQFHLSVWLSLPQNL